MLHPKAKGKITWIAPAGEYTLNVRLHIPLLDLMEPRTLFSRLSLLARPLSTRCFKCGLCVRCAP